MMIAAIALASAAVSPAAAEDASAWDTDMHAAARLIAGATRPSADAPWLRAGIEIKLDPGWKTYWRYPGDSGVPPKIDFTGSENVKSVATLWPAPEKFSDGSGGYSIGYVGDLILPLRVTPRDASKPALLRVKLGYAVCGNLCVPAEAQLDLALPGQPSAEDEALSGAEKRVPRRVPLGANGSLTVRSVHRVTDNGHAHVVVDIASHSGAPVDLFAEGPTPEWSLPLPKAAKAEPGSAPGTERFTFDLDGMPPGAHAEGATLTLTAVSSDDAIEVEAHLD